ncbi:hypothetical protein [Zavarzinella formosa]|uniref:hypothetical protein n=1 Tax=Zavarzinella formosa TaxID=360055 RepID=UPI0002E14FCB|nr:hypothetical protein [Zavarzinella formosa]
MSVVLLREAETATDFLLQGLWFQRAMPPHGSAIRTVLEWTLEIAAGGQPLLPTGMIADLGHIAYGSQTEFKYQKDAVAVPGVAPGLLRTYEDHVLGKFYADWTVERASDAMRRFQGRDRARGLAYFIKQFRERAGIGGIELSPGLVRTMLEGSPEELLRRGWESLNTKGPLPELVALYEQTIAASRRMAEVLSPADIDALEKRTALAEMGQYVAHRQVVQLAHRLEELLPRRKVKPLPNRREVPTRVLDEDTYPVGGFTSISNKGTVESLLHSQLAYIEPDPAMRPDLFDVKYVRDELYYYSRDENQFLRRRRTFVFALMPDLVKSRFKDPELPAQRIVLVLASLVTLVRRIADWLSSEALKFEIVFVEEKEGKTLGHESELCETLFREEIANGLASITHLNGNPCQFADERAARSMCHLLVVSMEGGPESTQHALTTQMTVSEPRPVLWTETKTVEMPPSEDPVEAWAAALEHLLMLWV